MINNHMKKWSTFLVTKGMKIKTTKSLHHAATRMTTIKKKMDPINLLAKICSNLDSHILQMGM